MSPESATLDDSKRRRAPKNAFASSFSRIGRCIVPLSSGGHWAAASSCRTEVLSVADISYLFYPGHLIVLIASWQVAKD